MATATLAPLLLAIAALEPGDWRRVETFIDGLRTARAPDPGVLTDEGLRTVLDRLGQAPWAKR